MKKKKVDKIICPDCKIEIKLKKGSNIGDIVECAGCGTEVELLSLDPLRYEELLEEK